MKKLIVPKDPCHAMEAISVGAGCSFDCALVGVDPRFESVEIAFGLTGDTYANRVTAKPVPGGEWNVAAPAAYFPTACKAHYHVTGSANGASTYLGGGTLRVLAAVPPAPTPTPSAN